MKSREEYIAKMTEQLKEWSRKIDELEFKGRVAKADIKIGYEKRIRELKDKRSAVKGKLSELKGSSGEAWDSLQRGVESAWSEFKNAFSNAKDKFKKAG